MDIDFDKQCITITFGDQAENHKGMQVIGNLAEEGFNLQDLENIKVNFENIGCRCTIYNLSKDINTDENLDAHLLLIKNGTGKLLENVNKNATDLFKELISLDYDDKALMYGRVVNKHARHNLCFSDFSQKSNYKKGKGSVVDFKDVKLLNHVRNRLDTFCGNKAKKLEAEANLYYDVNKCGIGYHGDSERKIVVGLRLGDKIPLVYQWYRSNEKVGDKIIFNNIENGDIYVMSEKTTGFDWKKKNIYTLRHAAGCSKYTE